MLLLLWVSAAALCNLYEPGQNEGVGQGTPKKVGGKSVKPQKF